MSYELYAIVPHRLNVSSVYSLGNDIAHRLQVNIGCYANDEYNITAEMKGSFCWSDKINLGSVALNASLPQWFLREEFYNIKKYHKKYGYDLYDHPYFKLNPAMIDSFAEIRDTAWYQLFSDKDEKQRVGHVFSELCALNVGYFIGWNNFYRALEKHQTEAGTMRFASFRKELYIACRTFGGDRAVYFNDEKDACHFIYSAIQTAGWSELLSEINHYFGKRVVNISRCIRNETDFEFNGKSMAFYDDFSDLKFAAVSNKNPDHSILT